MSGSPNSREKSCAIFQSASRASCLRYHFLPASPIDSIPPISTRSVGAYVLSDKLIFLLTNFVIDTSDSINELFQDPKIGIISTFSFCISKFSFSGAVTRELVLQERVITASRLYLIA